MCTRKDYSHRQHICGGLLHDRPTALHDAEPRAFFAAFEVVEAGEGEERMIEAGGREGVHVVESKVRTGGVVRQVRVAFSSLL